MVRTILSLVFVSAISQAAVHSFISCKGEEGQTTLKKVRNLLHKKIDGEPDIVGIYEFIKNRQVVGYLPFYYDQGKQVIAEAFLCLTSGHDYYYVDGAAQDIKYWMPKANEVIISKSLFSDEAVGILKLSKVNNKDTKVDFFIRSLIGNREVVKDIAILSLVPKRDL